MPFVFATCRAGSEITLKNDVASWYGGQLKPAFMRPQLISWKTDEELDAGIQLESPYARVSGLSLGICKTSDEIVEKVRSQGLRSICLHPFPRETPEDGVPAVTWQKIDARRADIAAALTSAGITVKSGSTPLRGEVVLDLIFDEADDSPVFVGIHRHDDGMHSQPGALPRLTLPSHAPSRSWLKLEQALAWRGWDQLDLKGKNVLELGCSPGGATLAMLDRGMRVVGVDSRDMDESILRHDSGAFRHVRTQLARVDPEKLPGEIAMIFCDVNASPLMVLPDLERLQKAVRAPKVIAILKMNSPALEAQLEDFVSFIRSFSPAPVHVTQLPAQRREVCVAAG